MVDYYRGHMKQGPQITGEKIVELHKKFSNPMPPNRVIHGSFTDDDGIRREMSQEEANQIMVNVDAADDRRRKEIPDVFSALSKMLDIMQRMQEFGWRDAIYCPKDGSHFALIHYQSSGIFFGCYIGEWPTGDIHYQDCVSPPEDMWWKDFEKLTEQEREHMNKCTDDGEKYQERQAKMFAAMAEDCEQTP